MKYFQSFFFIFLRRTIVFGTIGHLTVLIALPTQVAIPAPAQHAIEYHNISNLVWGVNQIFALLFPAILLVSGLGTRVLFVINKLVKCRKFPALIIFAAVFFLLNWIIQLPLTRLRTNTFNQIINIESPPILLWIFTQFLEALPMMVVSILIVLFGHWLMTKSPQRWWLWAACICSFLLIIFLMGEPFIKTYKSLGNTPLEIKIAELAEQVGIPRKSVVLENCEPIDDCEDGHVIGLGPTRLMVLNEGYFQTRPESWTIQTVAHEAKHFAKDDNLTGFLVLTMIFFICFWLLNIICNAVIQRFSKQLNFATLGQPASLPLIFLILTLIYLAVLPPVNMFRQHVEFEADRYGLELTHQNEVFAKMVSSWTSESKIRVPNPSLFFMIFRSSHPSDAERIAFANNYHPWSKEEPVTKSNAP